MKRPNTDPGLGPAGPPTAPAAVGPLPVRVPPVGKQDSVELLLDNMSEPQPERQKMTPQSAGEAAAAYHAEHPLHPARTEPDEEPKVIVERPPLAPTVRVQREKLQGVIEEADARRRAAEADAEAAAQAPVPLTMGPKVLIAAVAGLLVVLVIFVVARGGRSAGTQGGTTGGAATTATATATATVAATATGAATATATIPVADTTEAPVAAPPPTAHVPVTALPAAPPTAPAATAKPKPRPASSGTSGDLGEFKPTFH